MFLGGDFDKWETLFCILLEPWVLFRPGCIVRRNQRTLYLTPQSGLHKPTSRAEQGGLAPEGHWESAEVARLKPVLAQPPAQFLAAPPAPPRHHPPIPNASIACMLSAAALLPLGCPVAPLQSCSLLLSSLSRGVQQNSKGQLCSPAAAGPWSWRQHGRMEIVWSCALLSCLSLCSALDASTTRAPQVEHQSQEQLGSTLHGPPRGFGVSGRVQREAWASRKGNLRCLQHSIPRDHSGANICN